MLLAQVEARHVFDFALQTPDEQSELVTHDDDPTLVHGGQFCPPQSTSVSSPFCILSLHCSRLHELSRESQNNPFSQFASTLHA
mmetsp:Transcript_27001/g.43484  ORF Transcript_27001/g.43484 Transcript_27001/m.43484 type:complete len:84 (-) Transcript_27001:4704-4955(-)